MYYVQGPVLYTKHIVGRPVKIFCSASGEETYLKEHSCVQKGECIKGYYGITGGGVFKAGTQNWKGFCIKINCSQMKLSNFENWTNWEPQ